MSAPEYTPRPLTVEDLFRRHLREMRSYADTLVPALGSTNPIVARIKACATSNEVALDALLDRKCKCDCRRERDGY